MKKNTLWRLMTTSLVLLLTLCATAPQLLAQEDNLLVSLQIKSAKNVRQVLRLAGKTNKLWIDFGDGSGKQQFAVPDEVPEDLNQLKEIPFTVRQENPTIKVYGAGIRAFGFFRTGSILDLQLVKTNDLQVLAVDNTHLASLNLNGCPNLEVLQCFGNFELTSLDLSHSPKLKQLQIQYTGLQSIDLTPCKDLEVFLAFNSQLKEVLLGSHPKLWFFKADEAHIRSLDLSKCPALQLLHMNTNDLSNLTLKGNVALSDIQLGENKHFSQANWNEAPALRSLYLDQTAVAQLDLRSLHHLEILQAQQSQLEMLKVSDQAHFSKMMLWGNKLSACALDTLYASLAPLPAGDQDTIYLRATADFTNPGLETSRTEIAKNKGYLLLDVISLEQLVGDATGCPGSNVGVEYIPRTSEQCLIPIDGERRYQINEALGLDALLVYDKQGQLIIQQLATTTQLDLSRLPAGQYIVLATALNGQTYGQTLIL